MTKFDAVSLEVLWRRLISIVDEASAALVRTSFSSVVRESHDFACVITTLDGELLAQATQSIPSFIGTLPRTVRFVAESIGADRISPDDVFITNDPWMGTGHLPDINIVKPIFRGGRLIAFAAAVSHVVDIGGRGSSVAMRDIFEEGLQIPPMKLLDAGQPNETLLALIAKNVRAPEAVLGDIWAQVASADLIERRLLSLLKEYELADIADLANAIMDRSETAMRGAIAKVAPGVYSAVVRPDGMKQQVEIRLQLTIGDGECRISFDGTSSELEGVSINSVYAYSAAYATYGLKSVFAPALANNGGALRPIRVDIPEGSVLNHRYPKSGMMRHLVAHHLSSAVVSALADALPDQVMAQSGTPIWYFQQSGVDSRGKPYANMFFFNGGTGAMSSRDGANVLSWPSNISGTPIETIERIGPFVVEEKSLREDSGGAGEFRGGLGQEISFRVTETTPISVAFAVDHLTVPPEGLAGGGAGATGELLINGKPVDPHVVQVLGTGDLITIRTPGGGGYGAPSKRSAARAAADLRQGYVTRQPASDAAGPADG